MSSGVEISTGTTPFGMINVTTDYSKKKKALRDARQLIGLVADFNMVMAQSQGISTIWTVGSWPRHSQQSGRGCSQRFQKIARLFQKPQGMLQNIQVYNTIGLCVVSIEIWPSTDSMYFKHYLHVLAVTPIIWKTAISSALPVIPEQ